MIFIQLQHTAINIITIESLRYSTYYSYRILYYRLYTPMEYIIIVIIVDRDL